MMNRKVQTMLYEKATTPKDLPWHRDKPDRFLVEAIRKREKPGRALDLGCGSGVFSVYMAREGYDVTGIDFMERAVEMSRERADREGVSVNWVHGNLFSWESPDTFDLILDSGCLHSLIGGDRSRYKAKLQTLLAPGGEYILGHFGKRNIWDWRPVGPTRKTRRQIVELFSPELTELDYEQELMTGIPFPIGPTVQGQCFWFKRSN